MAEDNEIFKDAQKRLIGSLLADGSRVNRVLETVSVENFEEPDLQLIFEAVTIVARANQEVSILSVAEQLEKLGNLTKVGNAGALYRLQKSGQRWRLENNPEVYASVVREYSAKSRVGTTLDEFRELFKPDSGQSAANTVSELQNSLNSELYKLSDESTVSEFAGSMEEYFEVLKERAERARANEESAAGLQGIPSLLPTIDKYTSGWLPGQLVTVGARTGVGKALALDTPIPTPNGWSTMGDLKVGDEVFGRDGLPTKVVNATDVQLNRTCYEVVFSNGEVIVADEDHRWLTETHLARRAYSKNHVESVKTTKDILNSLKWGEDRRSNHSIKLTSPIVFPEKKLPIDPYVLGYWLGDGTSRRASISVHKDDFDNINRELSRAGLKTSKTLYGDTYEIRFSKKTLTRGGDMTKKYNSSQDLIDLNLVMNKHVPHEYMTSGVKQREELLKGLMDSDGYTDKNGRQFLCLTNKRLFDDALELANSLGLAPTVTKKDVKGKNTKSSIAYILSFSVSVPFFKLDRKKVRVLQKRHQREGRVYIKEIRPVDSVPVRCIQVDNEEHVYLAGRSMIPTHNTVFAVNCATAAAAAGKSVLFFSLEMGEQEIKDRMVSSITGIPMDHLKKGSLSDDEFRILREATGQIDQMKVTMDTDPKVTIDAIRARALRKAQSDEGLDMVILDYLQLITPMGRYSSRQEAVADMSRNMKLLAKQLQVPVMVLVQMNRAQKGDEEDDTPRLDNIRESGAIAQDSDIVILLHREHTLDDSIPHTLVILAKNRAGAADKTVRCHSNLECSLFREVQRAKDVEESITDEDIAELDNYDDDDDIDFGDDDVEVWA